MSQQVDLNTLPSVVTFLTGSHALMKLGIVDRITAAGLRGIAAREGKTWPFGDGAEHPTWKVGNATVMSTEPFVDFFRQYFAEHPHKRREQRKLTVPTIPDAPRSPKPSPPQPTALYRFFREDGQLLYVGITTRLRRRWQEHAAHYATTWWPQVSHRTVDWYDTRQAALDVEERAIKSEKPLYNIMHTPSNRGPLAQRRVIGVSKVPGPRRGERLLEVANALSEAPFTQTDLMQAASLSPAAVNQNVRVLVSRGDLVAVGTRRVIGTSARPHILYGVPGTPSGQHEEPIRELVPPSSSCATQRTRGKSMGQVMRCIEDFGDQSFTQGDVAKRTGLTSSATSRIFQRLLQAELIKKVGFSPAKQATGYQAALYALTSRSQPAWRDDA